MPGARRGCGPLRAARRELQHPELARRAPLLGRRGGRAAPTRRCGASSVVPATGAIAAAVEQRGDERALGEHLGRNALRLEERSQAAAPVDGTDVPARHARCDVVRQPVARIGDEEREGSSPAFVSASRSASSQSASATRNFRGAPGPPPPPPGRRPRSGSSLAEERCVERAVALAWSGLQLRLHVAPRERRDGRSGVHERVTFQVISSRAPGPAFVSACSIFGRLGVERRERVAPSPRPRSRARRRAGGGGAGGAVRMSCARLSVRPGAPPRAGAPGAHRRRGAVCTSDRMVWASRFRPPAHPLEGASDEVVRKDASDVRRVRRCAARAARWSSARRRRAPRRWPWPPALATTSRSPPPRRRSLPEAPSSGAKSVQAPSRPAISRPARASCACFVSRPHVGRAAPGSAACWPGCRWRRRRAPPPCRARPARPAPPAGPRPPAPRRRGAWPMRGSTSGLPSAA